MIETTDLTTEAEIVEIKGELWQFSHIKPELRGEVCAYIKAKARKECDNAWFNEQLLSGGFKWGSPLEPRYQGSAIKAGLKDEDTAIYLIQLLLRAKHGPISVAKVGELFDTAAEEIQAAVARCLDPNLRAPAPAPANEKTPAQETKETKKTEAAA